MKKLIILAVTALLASCTVIIQTGDNNAADSTANPSLNPR